MCGISSMTPKEVSVRWSVKNKTKFRFVKNVGTPQSKTNKSE